jgi:hypothetical protein
MVMFELWALRKSEAQPTAGGVCDRQSAARHRAARPVLGHKNTGTMVDVGAEQ